MPGPLYGGRRGSDGRKCVKANAEIDAVPAQAPTMTMSRDASCGRVCATIYE